MLTSFCSESEPRRFSSATTTASQLCPHRASADAETVATAKVSSREAQQHPQTEPQSRKCASTAATATAAVSQCIRHECAVYVSRETHGHDVSAAWTASCKSPSAHDAFAAFASAYALHLLCIAMLSLSDNTLSQRSTASADQLSPFTTTACAAATSAQSAETT